MTYLNHIHVPSKPSNNRKIFVGGLKWETTQDALVSYFEDYGHVIDVVIMKDAISSKSRGFGFVQFEDPTVADSVVNKSHMIEGKSVDVKRAVPRDGSAAQNDNTSEKIFVVCHL